MEDVYMATAIALQMSVIEEDAHAILSRIHLVRHFR